MKNAKLILGSLALLLCMANLSSATITYRGQATAASATVLGLTTSISDTGLIPTQGGVIQKDLVTVGIPGVLSGVVSHAAALSFGDHTSASASIAGLNLLAGGQLITADLIQSQAYAAVSKGKLSVINGYSVIANLVVNGQPIVITGQPNQTIPLLLGKIVINEQTQGSGSMDVVALHITLAGIVDAKLARSYAVVGPCSGCNNTCTATPNCAGSNDFIVGSGAVKDSLNVLANFGLALGLNKGLNWGGLVFSDPNSNIAFQATSVLQYLVTNATQRHITGVGKLNGLSTVNYILDLTDNGVDGSKFVLTLSNGYSISGTVDLGFVQIQPACSQ